jgi:uncharacterized protein (DUF2235 family)
VSKRVVVLSDGTGNAAASIWRTNVWRMFDSLVLGERECQVAFYDDGVGTSRLKPLAWFGGMFGYGLKRNVIECYKFICRNYRPGDDIFLFGFSRGAFTVRVLADWILNQGLVAYDNNEAELGRLVITSYRAYRKAKCPTTNLRVEKLSRILRDFVLQTPYSEARQRQVSPPSIKFIGVWDTVGAYGLPVAELTRFISRWIFPFDLPDVALNTNVERACHALSVDDERKTFEPLLWAEKDDELAELAAGGSRYICGERISQVWFPGVHSNVGGGYPDDSLAYVPLVWMMEEAHQCGLTFKASSKYEPDALRHARSAADKDGRLYNPRSGIGAYYRYGPRKISELCNAVEIKTPKIHHTVFERIRDGVHPYAPIGLPATYAVVDKNGKTLQGDENPYPYENTSQATERAQKQETVWDLVELRRLIYLGTVAVSLYLVLYPVIFVPPQLLVESQAAEHSSRLSPVSQLVRFGGSFLPDTFNLWVNGYAQAPGQLLIGLMVLIIFTLMSSKLRRKSGDEMLALWRSSMSGALKGKCADTSWAYRWRTNRLVRVSRTFLLNHAIPPVATLSVVYLTLALLGHLAFKFFDAAGLYCQESPHDAQSYLQPGEMRVKDFEIDSLCYPTGVMVEEGQLYDITIEKLTAWRAGSQHFSLQGFSASDVKQYSTRVLYIVVTPFRRILTQPWLKMMLRVGGVGAYEEFVAPDVRSVDISERLRFKRSGELFLYVNDAVLPVPVPWLAGVFYKWNSGTAELRIKRVKLDTKEAQGRHLASPHSSGDF